MRIAVGALVLAGAAATPSFGDEGRVADLEAELEKVGRLTPEDLVVAEPWTEQVGRAWTSIERWRPQDSARWRALKAQTFGARLVGLNDTILIQLEVTGAPRLRALPDGSLAIDLSALGFPGDDGVADWIECLEAFADLAFAAPGAVSAAGEVRRPEELGRARLDPREDRERRLEPLVELEITWRRPNADRTAVERFELSYTSLTDDGERVRPWLFFATDLAKGPHAVHRWDAEDARRGSFRLRAGDPDGAAEAVARALGIKLPVGPQPALAPLDDRTGLPLPFGAPRARVIALLGERCTTRTGPDGTEVLSWAHTGITARLRAGRLEACEIRFHPDAPSEWLPGVRTAGYAGRTPGGLGGDSTVDDVVGVLGEPEMAGGGRGGGAFLGWWTEAAMVVASFEGDALERLVFEAPE